MDNDFRPPIAAPSERTPSTIEQVDQYRVTQPWGLTAPTTPAMDRGSIARRPIGGKGGK
jgi:hypothetical protein